MGFQTVKYLCQFEISKGYSVPITEESWDDRQSKLLTYLIIVVFWVPKILHQLREADVPGIFAIATTCTAIPRMAPHATFTPGKPFWAANKPRRRTHNFSVQFIIIFITTICISRSWSTSSPSFASLWSWFCALVTRSWVFTSIITICILVIIGTLMFSNISIVSSPPQMSISIATLWSPHKCSCSCFSCCSFPS